MKPLALIFTAAMLCMADSAWAGNVSASIRGGHLYVYGDNNPSSIVIQSTGSGRIQVTGASIEGQGTTVNSRTTPATLSGWTGGIYVYLYGGTDSVTVYNAQVNGPAHFDVGSGNDDVLLGEPIEATFAAAMESEAAAMTTVQTQFRSSLFVIGADGADLFTIDDSQVFGRATLDLGNGNDEAYFTYTEFHDSLVAVPGAGADLTDLFGTNVHLDLIIDDATEEMDVEISDVGVRRNVYIYGTSAADFVRAVGLRAASIIQIFTESANDYVQISGQTPKLEIFAGSGTDDVRVQSMNATRTNVFLDAGFDRLTVSDSDISELYAYGAAKTIPSA